MYGIGSERGSDGDIESGNTNNQRGIWRTREINVESVEKEGDWARDVQRDWFVGMERIVPMSLGGDEFLRKYGIRNEIAKKSAA